MTRGEIWWADLGGPSGSEPGLLRPVLIIQDNSFNESHIPTIIIACLTTNLTLAEAPGNVFMPKSISKLPKDSIVNVSQIASLDRGRFEKKNSKLDRDAMFEVDKGLKLVLGLP
jgi:mRNA interferase MazF